MGLDRRVVVLAVFGLFLVTLLLRPVTRLVSRGFSGEGFSANALALAAPGIVVLLVMLLVAVVVVRRADGDADVGEVLTMRNTSQNPDDQRENTSQNPDDQRENTSQNPEDQREERRPGASELTEDTEDSTSTDTPEDDDSGRPSFLSGQGGTRNKGFEIEEEPPDTDLDDHMRYLRERLDDEDLDGVDEVDTTDSYRDEEADGKPANSMIVEEAGEAVSELQPSIPDECPQPYCDARWKKGGLLGGRGGRYELLNGGEQVRCEECDSITTLE